MINLIVFSSILNIECTEKRVTGIENRPEWSNGTANFDRTGPTEKSGPPRKGDWLSKSFSVGSNRSIQF